MACFLDPETNKYLTEEEKIRVETEIIKFLNKEEKECHAHFDKDEEKKSESKPQRNEESNSKENENLLDNFAKICCFDDFESKKIRSKRVKTIKEEIAFFLTNSLAKLDFQTFWKSYSYEIPRLANLNRRLNTIPATSVASESTFSIAGFIIRKERSGMCSRNLKYSLILRDEETLNSLANLS